jgi:hypothetical protein
MSRGILDRINTLPAYESMEVSKDIIMKYEKQYTENDSGFLRNTWTIKPENTLYSLTFAYYNVLCKLEYYWLFWV